MRGDRSPLQHQPLGAAAFVWRFPATLFSIAETRSGDIPHHRHVEISLKERRCARGGLPGGCFLR